MKVEAHSFIETVRANVGNKKLSDKQFRSFIESSLDAVETVEERNARVEKAEVERLSKFADLIDEFKKKVLLGG